MKSLIVTHAPYIKDKENYSDLRVMKSGAGYYIGTVYHNLEGFDEPGSRDSQYFETREEAELALKCEDWEQRINP